MKGDPRGCRAGGIAIILIGVMDVLQVIYVVASFTLTADH